MAEPIPIETIQQQLCVEIQTLLALKPGAVTTDTSLPTLGIDSLRFVSLMLAIEQRFGVSMMKPGLKREEMKSVRAMAAAVAARRKVSG